MSCNRIVAAAAGVCFTPLHHTGDGVRSLGGTHARKTLSPLPPHSRPSIFHVSHLTESQPKLEYQISYNILKRKSYIIPAWLTCLKIATLKKHFMFCIAPELMVKLNALHWQTGRRELNALKQEFHYLLVSIFGMLKAGGENTVKPAPTSSPGLLPTPNWQNLPFKKHFKNHLRFNFVI